MPLSDLPRIQQGASTAQINDYLIMLGRRLNDFLNHLDTLNVDELDAEVVIANTITADKMNVTQLSAIAADLGTITAGIIYGAYIATANGTYPRIELSSAGNLLKAFYDAVTYVAINPGIGGAIDPFLQFVDATTTSLIGNTHLFGHSFQVQSNQDVNISSSLNDVNILATLGNISFQSSAGTISDLVTSINNLNSSISSLNTTIAGKQNAFSGLTGTTTVITGVNFGLGTTTSETLHFTNGVLTSIT